MAFFVSVTRLRIRALRFLPGFVLHTFRSLRQVRRSPGFVGGALLPDARRTFWTLTLWDQEASMRAFMTRGAHRAAMARLSHWCDEASVAHWEASAPVLPTWTEADLRLRREGRPSKVRFPSPSHADMMFAEPRPRASRPIRPET